MSREIILEALNGIRDEFIIEAGAKLGLLAVGAAGAVGAASGAAVEPPALYSLSGTEATAKAGFGAWVAKGGWIALAAGVLVAAGVAVGAFSCFNSCALLYRCFYSSSSMPNMLLNLTLNSAPNSLSP